MGWIRESAVDNLGKNAAEAHARGDALYLVTLHSATVTGALDGAIEAGQVWGQRINSVEGAGWRLEQWSVANDPKGRPVAYAIFRRG